MRRAIKFFQGNHNTHNKESGFTLVEIAVVMVVIGLMTASFLQLYKIYNTQQKIDKTELTQKLVTLSLDEFKRRYGRYPCPAPLDATRDEPEYGREGDCTDLSVTPGQCENGICVETSERTVTLRDGTVITPRVRRGAVPFRDMFLSEREMYDAYGGRLSYAVTEILTDSDTFDVGSGGISIVDNQEPTPVSLVTPEGSALYFVYSHGPDNVGAYGRSGALIAECGGTMYDNENCNTSATNVAAVYRDSLQSDVAIDTLNGGVVVPGAPGSVNVNTHYDDVPNYRAGEEQPIWKMSELGASGNAHDLLPDDENLAIGITDRDQKLNVGGDIRASDSIRTENVCNQDGSGCFESFRIGGSGMLDCVDTGDAGVGVAQKRILCEDPSNLTINCEGRGGRFIVGFDNSGEVICADIDVPDECEARTVNLCNQPRTLPLSQHNAVVSITAGASRTQTWRCNDGNWQQTSTTGVCNCTPGSTTSTVPCGLGYTGTRTTTTTTVCPSGQVTSAVTANTCVCTATTENRTRNCPGNFQGTINEQRPYTCVGGVATPGAWTETGRSCICPPATQTRNANCAANLTGTILEARTMNTSTCQWGDWAQQSSTCNCVGRTENRDVNCPAQETGTIRQSRTLSCPGATWSNWAEVSRNCQCLNRQQSGSRECPAGSVGSIATTRTVDCRGVPVSGAAGQYSDVPGGNSCQAAQVCSWQTVGSPQGTSNGGSPRSGANCECGTASRTCYKLVSAAGNIYQAYSCNCQ